MILNENICPVVMLSSLTHKGAVTTFECLELGAFDYVGKPDGTVSSDLGSVASELILKLKAAAGMERFSGPANSAANSARKSSRQAALTGTDSYRVKPGPHSRPSLLGSRPEARQPSWKCCRSFRVT